MTGIQEVNKEYETRGYLFKDLPNDEHQLIWAAAHLATGTFARPKDWGEQVWKTLCALDPHTRLAVSASMLAIALDKIYEQMPARRSKYDKE